MTWPQQYLGRVTAKTVITIKIPQREQLSDLKLFQIERDRIQIKEGAAQ